MRISVSHTLDDLENDMRDIVRRAPRELRGIVRDNVRDGNRIAKANARRTAGRHGKLYHRAFSGEMHGMGSFSGGVNVYSGEYGPVADMDQGDMSFERGSQNQPPHWDLAKSADIVGPAMAFQVGRTVAGVVLDVTRAAQLEAVKVAINAQFTGDPAVTFEEAAGATEDHIIVYLERRYVADQQASGEVTIPGGRLMTRYVVRFASNDSVMRERVAAALEDKILPLAGGGEVGPFVFESEAAVDDDEDGWLSGDDVWTF